MAIGKLVQYVRDARAEGHNDIQIRQALLSVSWSERDIKEALAAADIPSQAPLSEKAVRRNVVLSRIGKLLQLIFTLLLLVLLVRIGIMYAGFGSDPVIGSVLASFTNWMVAPFAPYESLLVSNNQLLGLPQLPLATLQAVPGGVLDIPAILALVAYAIVYVLLARIVAALFRRIKRS